MEPSILKGQTLTCIQGGKGDDQIIFTTTTGDVYRMFDGEAGSGNCVEVTVEDVVGDWSDLIGSPLLLVEETIGSHDPEADGGESYTWTFYRFATVKGYVTVRWYGESNGYYSETVDFEQVNNK